LRQQSNTNSSIPDAGIAIGQNREITDGSLRARRKESEEKRAGEEKREEKKRGSGLLILIIVKCWSHGTPTAD
jgi:hypothetical protein